MSNAPFFEMPEGPSESLRDRLSRSGALPVPDAVHLLRDVALALAHTHNAGIVHRDLKPESVLLSGSAATIMDSGLRTAASDPSTPGTGGLASSDLVVGTPAYMAPEYAAGDTAADRRADIYSFGCLAYEALTGRLPFTGRSPGAILVAHATAAPEPIERDRETLPPRLAALVTRCRPAS